MSLRFKSRQFSLRQACLRLTLASLSLLVNLAPWSSAAACDQCGTACAVAFQQNCGCAHGCSRPTVNWGEKFLDGLDHAADRFERQWNQTFARSHRPAVCDTGCDTHMAPHAVQLNRLQPSDCDVLVLWSPTSGAPNTSKATCPCGKPMSGGSCSCGMPQINSMQGQPIQQVPGTGSQTGSPRPSTAPKPVRISPKQPATELPKSQAVPPQPGKLPDWLNDPFRDEARLQRVHPKLPDVSVPVESPISHAYDAQAYISKQRRDDLARQKLFAGSPSAATPASASITKNSSPRTQSSSSIRRKVSDGSDRKTATLPELVIVQDHGVVPASSAVPLPSVPHNSLRR